MPLQSSPPAQPAPAYSAPPPPPPADSAGASSVLSSKTDAALSGGEPSALGDEVYISYARSKHPWLFEIFSVGGMTPGEVRNRVKSKMDEDEHSTAAPSTPGSANAAFANLNKELNKKFKK